MELNGLNSCHRRPVFSSTPSVIVCAGQIIQIGTFQYGSQGAMTAPGIGHKIMVPVKSTGEQAAIANFLYDLTEVVNVPGHCSGVKIKGVKIFLVAGVPPAFFLLRDR